MTTTDRDPATDAIITAGVAVQSRINGLAARVSSPSARQDLARISGGVQDMLGQAEIGRANARAQLENLDLHPDGRAKRSAEAITAAEAAIDQTAASLEGLSVVATASLTAAALTVKQPAKASTAAEAALRLAKDPRATFEAMATGDEDDDVVALLASSWGRRVGQAIGIDPELMAISQPLVLERLTNSLDPERKRAAEVALEARKLQGWVTPVAGLARDALRR